MPPLRREGDRWCWAGGVGFGLSLLYAESHAGMSVRPLRYLLTSDTALGARMRAPKYNCQAVPSPVADPGRWPSIGEMLRCQVKMRLTKMGRETKING